ncbi:hypothetical protein EUGRSUZ_G03139 [Eucalyptus grandis]|uniref:Uncharacterized protein n=2 Tax=Eucalyptus grandis TaxID=71139 RepID=A0ACC3K9H0_EUCGR|nr:hypothetical protein EUGRSUZ_G03139 [Eucalyptus grandis]
MSKNRVFLILLLVSIPCRHRQSGASPVWEYGKPSRLLEATKSKESSPAPSPGLDSGQKSPTNKSDPGSSPDPAIASAGGDGDGGKCSIPTETCRAGENLTACLHHPENDSKGTFVLVKNGGEVPLEGKIICLPANNNQTFKLTKQKTTVVNVTAEVGVCSSITVDAGNGHCTIPIFARVPASEGNIFKQFPYNTQVTPIHGLYLLLGMVVTIGGVWACCKFGKPERRVDGIPYQELEMGQADSASVNVVEAAEGWDESWDDDWGDEIREVKSPSRGPEGNAAKANGFTSRSSDRNGWEDNWDV